MAAQGDVDVPGQTLVDGSGTIQDLLTQSVAERLDNLANFLNEYPTSRVAITGYTDSSGPAAYNLKP